MPSGSGLRVVSAMFKHETNTFAPTRTTWLDFGDGGPTSGEAAIRIVRGTNQAIAGFNDIVGQRSATLTVPLCGRATPGGLVERAAFGQAWRQLSRSLVPSPDVILLDLHGAMVAEGIHDADAELVSRTRAVAPSALIGVTLDLHANLSPRLIETADVVGGYKTYPHIDMYDAGAAVAHVLLSRGRAGRMAAAYVPLLAHTLKMNTAEDPMRTLIAMAREAEAMRRVDIASVFGGFYSSDVPNAGLSVAAFGREAQQLCNEIARTAWDARDSFFYAGRPLAESVAAAAHMRAQPVILLDHCDNAASGATQDTMDVVKEALRQGLRDIVAGPICDPEAVRILVGKGIGAEVTLPVGGKTSVPQVGLVRQPLVLRGQVQKIVDGRFKIEGPMFAGVIVDMGMTVLFTSGEVRLVLTERRAEPFDLSPFRIVGIEPSVVRYLILKSKMHFRAAYEPICAAIVECDGSGVGTSDFRKLEYQRVRRPIYPLDKATAPAEPWARAGDR